MKNLNRLWLTIRPQKKTKEEKLQLLAKSMVDELFNDHFEGKTLTTKEIGFVATNFQIEMLKSLKEKEALYTQEYLDARQAIADVSGEKQYTAKPLEKYPACEKSITEEYTL